MVGGSSFCRSPLSPTQHLIITSSSNLIVIYKLLKQSLLHHLPERIYVLSAEFQRQFFLFTILQNDPTFLGTVIPFKFLFTSVLFLKPEMQARATGTEVGSLPRE